MNLTTTSVYDLKVKVSDFGFSREVPLASFTLTQLGTLRYMAPEVILNEGRYNCLVDMYSLGVIVHELATREVETDLRVALGNYNSTQTVDQ